MIGKLLPLLLILVGIGAGTGAGLFLRPEPQEDSAAECSCAHTAHLNEAPVGEVHGGEGEEGAPTEEYVKLNNQFVVPVVEDERVESMVVLSLSVEVSAGRKEEVYAREPKLRDAFLQVLFDHANMGGFRGTFTNANSMDLLRRALRETGRKVAGDLVSDVLIMDIGRHDT